MIVVGDVKKNFEIILAQNLIELNFLWWKIFLLAPFFTNK